MLICDVNSHRKVLEMVMEARYITLQAQRCRCSDVFSAVREMCCGGGCRQLSQASKTTRRQLAKQDTSSREYRSSRSSRRNSRSSYRSSRNSYENRRELVQKSSQITSIKKQKTSIKKQRTSIKKQRISINILGDKEVVGILIEVIEISIEVVGVFMEVVGVELGQRVEEGSFFMEG